MDQCQTQPPPLNVSDSDRLWAAGAHLLAFCWRC